MYYQRTIKYIFFISCAIALIYPLVNIYFIFPSFSTLSVQNTEDEAVRIAQHLAPLVVSEERGLKEPIEFAHEIERAKEEFTLEKLKVFSGGGEIIYSTDSGDIGKVNTKSYFHEIVARGNTYTKFVQKDTKTLEDRVVKADVVETYVPILSGGKFIGAFEIYYDITRRNQMLNRVVFRSSFMSFALMFCFFVALLIILLRIDRTTAEVTTGELSPSYQSPYYLLFLVAISIFAAEAVVMLFLSVFPPLSKLGTAIFDSSLLVMLISPMLYFFLFRPLLHYIGIHRQAEDELKRAHGELEERVKERTAELAEANEKLKQDFAEREKLEEQLRHAQKMEAIGTLTGGIAHEFNNILTTIIGCGEFLREEIDKQSPLREYVDVMQTAAQKAANLTQRLLAYSRKQITHKNLLSLNGIIEKVEGLVSTIIGEDIELKIVLTDDFAIMADGNLIEQVLMNLVTNGRDAMPNGGTITVSTEIIEMDDAFIRKHGYGEPGMYALISVSDTGTGMDEKTREKVFEPFFTTKDVGKGTGLGLSMVYGIIKKHSGYIDVESESGKGTTFKIYLPAIKTEIVETETVAVQGSPSGGSETVLVAEDDAIVRKGIRVLFENSGYRVIEAVDGEDAVEKFKENKDTIHLLILDVIMPKKNGKEAYNVIKTLKPDMKVLFISGYTDRVVQREEIRKEGLAIISKPFLPKELFGKVRDLLDS